MARPPQTKPSKPLPVLDGADLEPREPARLAERQRVRVVVEAPQHSGLWGALDYLSDLPLVPGALVRVPLGRRIVTGVVWDDALTSDEPSWDPSALKDVAEMLSGLPALPAAWRQLVAFAASYYQRSLGEMALMVLPPELRQLDAVQWQRRRKRLDKALAEPVEAGVLPTLPALTEQQALALDLLQGPADRPYLLWGST
ncbi:MAG: primosomal protein N', partial [Pseudomonadota bacterium]